MNPFGKNTNYDRKQLYEQVASFANTTEQSASTALCYHNLNKFDKFILAFDLANAVPYGRNDDSYFALYHQSTDPQTERDTSTRAWSFGLGMVSSLELIYNIRQIAMTALKIKESFKTSNDAAQFISEMKAFQTKSLNDKDKILVEEAINTAVIQKRLADRTKWLSAGLITKYALRSLFDGLSSSLNWNVISQDNLMVKSAARKTLRSVLFLMVAKQLQQNEMDVEYLSTMTQLVKKNLALP